MRRQPLTRSRALLWLALLGLGLVLSLLAGLSLGSSGVTPAALFGAGDPAARAILLAVRLPRVLLAAIVGGGLAVSGAALQGLFRNPLADPYVLGISGGASVGGLLALVVSHGGALAGPAGAFLGSLAALAIVERLATSNGRLNLYSLLLTGAIVNACAAALIYLLQSLASAEQLHAIVFHLMGRLPSLDLRSLALIAAASLAAVAALLWRARDFNALALGEEPARQLGVDVDGLKRWTFCWAALATAVAVAATGMIGFVGLIVPHALRLAAGPDHRLLLPGSLLAGGAFLVLSDLVARTALAPAELPVGVLTALVGGPVFLWLLRRRAGGGPLG